MTLDKILEKQRDFQKLAGLPIDSLLEDDRNKLSEGYILKTIEELAELRKTFPSVFNRYAKTQPTVNRKEVLKEFVDTLMFLTNFALVWNMNENEVLSTIEEVQHNNFIKIKEKLIAVLEDCMMRSPGTIFLGGGNLMPTYILVGQNPEKLRWNVDIYEHSSTMDFLKSSLELAGIPLDQIYYTNVVKEISENSSNPSGYAMGLWTGFLERELEIIQAGTSASIIPISVEVKSTLYSLNIKSSPNIIDPYLAQHQGWTTLEYADHLNAQLPL